MATDIEKGARQSIYLRQVTVLQLLVAFRICNALLVQTFFQPDEYFQSLEPAWQIAFGSDSGAWLTWVCCTPLSFLFGSECSLGMEAKA